MVHLAAADTAGRNMAPAQTNVRSPVVSGV